MGCQQNHHFHHIVYENRVCVAAAITDEWRWIALRQPEQLSCPQPRTWSIDHRRTDDAEWDVVLCRHFAHDGFCLGLGDRIRICAGTQWHVFSHITCISCAVCRDRAHVNESPHLCLSRRLHDRPRSIHVCFPLRRKIAIQRGGDVEHISAAFHCSLCRICIS